MVLEILVLLLLILGNAFFSMAEIAVISARKARLQGWIYEGRSGARKALELAEHPGHFISTVQFCMTLMGIVTGAFGGATVASRLASILGTSPTLGPYAEALALGTVILITTYLTLILGELAPKQLALAHAERLACMVARPMGALASLAAPGVAFLTWSASLVLRLFRAKPSAEPPVTEEELRILIDQGTRAGVFEESEQDMLERVLRLKDRQVRAFITPRSEIVWLDLEASDEENRRRIVRSPFSAFPVCRGGLDSVVGVARAKDILTRGLPGSRLDLEGLMRQPLFVPQGKPALDLLDSFKSRGLHMALVLDEYGGILGLATLNDILQGIVGELPSGDRAEASRAVRREDGSWLLDGMLPMDEFRDLFHLPKLPEGDRGAYQTVGGFVMAQLGHIPSAAEHFAWGRLRVEVVDMDGRRVDKVLVSEIEPLGPDPSKVRPSEGRRDA